MQDTNSLHELFDEYIKDCRYARNVRPDTIKGYKASFSMFSKLMPEIKNADNLTYEAMIGFFEKLGTRERTVGKGEKRTGVRESTVATYHSKLNSFFDWLRDREHIEENPLQRIQKPRVDYTDKKSLKKDDIEKIIAAIEMHSKNLLIKKRDKLIVFILFYCGLRRGELLGLRVVDIDQERRTLTVRSETSKSKSTRIIPVGRDLVLCLDDYLNERKKHRYNTPYLLVSNNNDRELSRDGLIHLVKRLNKQSGAKFHLHQFRHTFACALAKNGAGAVKIQSLLGHTDLRMTQRYVRSITPEDMRGDIDRLSIDGL